jgi:hypothetical protein
MRKAYLPAIAAALLAALPSVSSAAMPTLIWQGASAVRVQCLVGPGQDNAARPLQQTLCDRVVKQAAIGSPLPVSAIGFGDPQVIAPGTVALLVHGHIERDGDRRLLAFAIRPYRNSADQSSVLFGAPPRAALLTAAGAPTPALDAAILAALKETLPWRRGPVPTSFPLQQKQ